MRWFKQYDHRNFRAWAGPLPYVLFMEPEYVEAVLSSNVLTYKYDPYNLMYPWLGQGLLTSNAPDWSIRRKMITPSFHFRILKDFLHIINETTDRFMELLSSEFAATEKIFDFQKIVTRSTVDVICETAMGTRVNSIEGKPSRIVSAIDSICYVISERVVSVFKRIDFFYQFSPLYKQQQQALATLKSDLAKIIEERRAVVASSSYSANNNDELVDDECELKRPKMAFLDNLLTAEIDGKPLTFQQIFEEVSTFMFEGHDTTASAITFATYCLSRHPQVQERAYQEQCNIYGGTASALSKRRHPTFQELQDMKYLELVIKETLRIFPSVPFIFRTAKEATVIVDKYLPQDTTIVLPIIGLGHSPHTFTDPFAFKPDRFEGDKRSTSNPFEYVPFSAGPRNCIGQKFAMLELKVTLSKLLRNFHILPPRPGMAAGIAEAMNPDYQPRDYELKLNVPLTLKSCNGVYIKLKQRT